VDTTKCVENIAIFDGKVAGRSLKVGTKKITRRK
jgi:hypothetical protein